MANIIKPKRSNTASKVPTTSDLVSGEFGVNMADQKAYINNGSSIVQIAAGNLSGLGDVAVSSPSNGQSLIYNGTSWVNQTGAGSGDVVGPSLATDNAITRYDGTSGKLIQNSVATIDDSGNMAGVPTITDINYVDFNTGYATTLGAGQLGWDGNNTLGLGMIGGNVIQHIGEDQFFYCKASSAITKGQVVMFTGAVGASGVPIGAPATGITDGTYIMGVAAESIALNGFGLVQSFGTLRNVDTSGYSDGDILWYNPSVTGGLTSTKPSAPNVKVQMAAVINGGSSGGGTILIRINAGSVLGGTDSNVQFGTLATGDLIRYNGTYWTNVATIGNSNLTNSSITINGSAISLGGSVSVGTVTSVGMTVPTGLSISGTPITATGTLALSYAAGYSIPTTASQSNWDTAYSDRLKWDGGSTGLVAATGRTSLGATTLGSNLFTITNPSAITFPRFNADNTVSALDASTFRTAIGAGTGNGTVTSVAALTLGTTGTDLSSTVATGTTTPVITLNVPTASASNRGALSSTDWSTFNGKQAAYTNLSTIGALANGTGWLYNNGSGTFSYSTPTKSDVGLGNVTNDAQTKASIVPNTTPTAGQILVGNAGGTAYAPVSMSGDATLASTGAATLATVNSNVGSYTFASITVNAKGLVTAASNGVAASTSTNGYLTSTDWNTFNGKYSTGGALGTPSSGTLTNCTGYTYANLSGTVPTWNQNTTGNAATATNATNATYSTYASNPTFSADAVDKDDITTRTETGFYQSSTGTTAEGWPVNSGSWQHLIACTHTNDANYYSMQIAGSFFDNTFYGRKTNGSGTTGWVKFCTDLPNQIITDTFTANGSTTSFSTSQTYTSGKIEVFCNGVKMRNGSDVTVTSGTAVVFASTPANTSLIDVVYPI